MKKYLALLLAVLMLLPLLPVSAENAYSAFWIIEDSDTRLLTEQELWGYTRETLRYIRNEILARAGYAFETSKFYNYFNAKPWYIAGGYGTSRSLGTVAWQNIDTVKQVERTMDQLRTDNASGIDISTIINYQNAMGGYGNVMNYGNSRGNGSGLTMPETLPSYGGNYVPGQRTYNYTTQYIIPDSNIRPLTEGELWGYTRETLRYIRNELLARHGYAFTMEKFLSYFGGKAWYQAGGYDTAVLSSLEWDNISLIKKVERAMDDLGTDNAAGLDISTIRYNQQNNLCPGDAVKPGL